MISEPEKDSSGKPAPIVLDDDTAHLGLFLYVFRAGEGQQWKACAHCVDDDTAHLGLFLIHVIHS